MSRGVGSFRAPQIKKNPLQCLPSEYFISYIRILSCKAEDVLEERREEVRAEDEADEAAP